ncbi:MAG TPA: hypothetical protein VFM08_00735 [Nocardioides sp.]|jgi:hypothetical protein|nr:hypothetical protein [Nocardioides sp.]
MHHQLIRRAPGTLAAVVLGVVALLAPLTSPASAGPAHDVRVAKAATKDFQHPKASTKAGYGLLKDSAGIACIAMKGMGAMGVHYANPALVGDGKIQLRHPEALVYRFTTNGHLKLAAIEYVVLRADWRKNHPTGRPELFGHRFNFTPKGNRFGLPAYFSLHAWLWYDNPAGTYQMFNPKVHCPAGI